MSTNDRASHIEECGLFFENLGATRMSGRIFGYLMVTDKEDVSFDELTQVLNASKSSISNNVKALIQMGFIKPITHSGDRKTYYYLTPGMNWGSYMEAKLKGNAYLSLIFGKALDLRVNKNDKTSKWLLESMEFFAWMADKITEVIKEWEEIKKSKE